MARKTKSTETELSFEDKLETLEKLVENLESTDLGLEKSLQEFERGTELIKDCEKALASAEQRIKILTDHQNEAELEDFDG